MSLTECFASILVDLGIRLRTLCQSHLRQLRSSLLLVFVQEEIHHMYDRLGVDRCGTNSRRKDAGSYRLDVMTKLRREYLAQKEVAERSLSCVPLRN